MLDEEVAQISDQQLTSITEAATGSREETGSSSRCSSHYYLAVRPTPPGQGAYRLYMFSPEL